jgi:hypothetical protein
MVKTVCAACEGTGKRKEKQPLGGLSEALSKAGL